MASYEEKWAVTVSLGFHGSDDILADSFFSLSFFVGVLLCPTMKKNNGDPSSVIISLLDPFRACLHHHRLKLEINQHFCVHTLTFLIYYTSNPSALPQQVSGNYQN
mmetsp:Transcript_13474/g.20482  ORF Transcript_13474/g.20482 Transcript_13474/m.20482 type:complete len:106 (+) Transcript_13474:95-412(+)